MKPKFIKEAANCLKEAIHKHDPNHFIKHAVTEPMNDPRQGYDMDTFCGACTWLALQGSVEIDGMKHTTPASYRLLFLQILNSGHTDED